MVFKILIPSININICIQIIKGVQMQKIIWFLTSRTRKIRISIVWIRRNLYVRTICCKQP